MRKYFVSIFISLLFCCNSFPQQYVIIVVVDGGRYTETFGSGADYMPNIWNLLKPAGTIYTNFYIGNGQPTTSMAGHSAILTGRWDNIVNDGTDFPTNPTLFEYFRKHTGAPITEAYLIGGKSKHTALRYSDHSDYGPDYQASAIAGFNNDQDTYNQLISVIDTYHPKLILVNFAQVDQIGHTNNWPGYLAALTQVDNLILQLWNKIQSDNFYKNNTTLFVLNDHGRHDDSHGGFQNHGDNCDGCRHIMLLAIGKNVNAGSIISDAKEQIDIAKTVGELMNFPTPSALGSSLYSGNNPLPVELAEFKTERKNDGILIEWKTASEIDNYGFELQRKLSKKEWEKIFFAEGYGSSNSEKSYSFFDGNPIAGKYQYRLMQIDNDGSFEYSNIVEIDFNPIKSYKLEQNYPNPFNPTTKIGYQISQSGFVNLKFFDLLGNEIAVLVDEVKNLGEYSIEFAAHNIPSGVYFYQIKVNDFVSTKKMLLMK
jgi:hypothetical protein